jgi:uncharacterized protein (TIGR02145 family)
MFKCNGSRIVATYLYFKKLILTLSIMKDLSRIRIALFSITGALIIMISGCQKNNDSPNTKTPAEAGTITDKDGNTYKTLTIGTQVWMASDLKTTKFSNGDAIPTTTLDISAESAPKYQWAYDNDATNANVYGRLYTWYVATDSRNVCPDGWHVPTYLELEIMKSSLGGESAAGPKLKEAGSAHWQAPNAGATNESGFTALPDGYRTFNGIFVSLSISYYMWSSSDDAPLGWGQSLHYDDNLFLQGGYYKQAGVSIRCLKNN